MSPYLVAASSGQENKAANGNQAVAYEGSEERKSQSKIDPGVMTMPVQEKEPSEGQVELLITNFV